MTFTIGVNKYFEKWLLSDSLCDFIEVVGFFKEEMPGRINDMRKQFSKKDLTGFRLLSRPFILTAKSYTQLLTLADEP